MVIMNYLNITKEDICNGDGLRVVLWLSGCSHHCYNCQNPQTWNPNNGVVFDDAAKQEIFTELSKDYVSGITFSGGDPLYEGNLPEVLSLIKEIRKSFPDKTIWLYTGYTWEDIWEDSNIIIDEYTLRIHMEYKERQEIVSLCDVVVDGEYIDKERDVTLKWCGSKNQRVIAIKETLETHRVVIYV